MHKHQKASHTADQSQLIVNEKIEINKSTIKYVKNEAQ